MSLRGDVHGDRVGSCAVGAAGTASTTDGSSSGNGLTAGCCRRHGSRVTTLRIEPVLEVLGDTELDLWPVVGRDGFWYQALHGDLTDREVGTAVHQILRWF